MILIVIDDVKECAAILDRSRAVVVHIRDPLNFALKTLVNGSFAQPCFMLAPLL